MVYIVNFKTKEIVFRDTFANEQHYEKVRDLGMDSFCSMDKKEIIRDDEIKDPKSLLID